MNALSQSTERPPAVTWVGLLIALFGLLIARQVILFFGVADSFTEAIWRESLFWLCAVALFIIIKRGERLPLRSVGIGTAKLSRSLIWGALLTVACAVIGFAIAALTHNRGGHTAESLAKLPTWLALLIVIRAGVIEELFYRGYAIERLRSFGLSKYWAALIPLLVFSVGHWRGGWANIVIAFALGGVLAASYLWRRDLVANIIGHFAVDFIGVILPRFVHHS